MNAAIGEPVGLIGMGLVGRALIQRLTSAGYRVTGYDTSSEARAAAAELGAEIAESATFVAGSASQILVSLPDSDIVSDVLWRQGVAAGLRDGATVLDTTTGRPRDAVDNARRLAQNGVRFVDVTLSGSSADIAKGTATALVGDAECQAGGYEAIIRSFAGQVFFLGQSGAGCLAKLVTNHVMGLNRAALAEGLAVGLAAGMDGETLLEVLRESAAYSRVIDMKGERMVRRDFEPASRIRQHAKDVDLILELAQDLGIEAPLEQVHAALLRRCIEAGWGDEDNAAIIRAYLDDAAGNG